jgi:hypothetical protein
LFGRERERERERERDRYMLKWIAGDRSGDG